MKDRILGEIDFVGGSKRPVYEEPDGRQYVIDDLGEVVYGTWIMPTPEILADVEIEDKSAIRQSETSTKSPQRNARLSFRVPIAIDGQGQLTRPSAAEKGNAYHCVACHEPVLLRKGAIKAALFAHKIAENCNPQTVIEKAAKLLLQLTVQDWKSGKIEDAPVLQRKCRICEKEIIQSLPAKVERAVIDFPLAGGSLADVALIVGDVAGAAIQVRPVPSEAEAQPGTLPIPFIELDGSEVIENPTTWNPVLDRFSPLYCESCRHLHARFLAKLNEAARQQRLDLPKAYYRSGLCQCWKCGKEIVVFTWPGHQLHSMSLPTIVPVPRTIQVRYSNMAGSRLVANTCPFCHSIQGDFYLYCEPDGPFFSFGGCEESPTSYEDDMMRIAIQAVEIGVLSV